MVAKARVKLMPIEHPPYKTNVMHYIVIIMAILLQIQATLFVQEGYLGLRVGIADLFLPFIGLYVLY